MIPLTARLFVDGPMRRILDLAALVRDSGGALSLDAELRRFIRTTRATVATDWVCPIATVTALLDHAAGLCDSGRGTQPEEFRQLLERAGAGTDWAMYLHSLAAKLRALEQDPQDDYEELPLSRWEIDVRFPQLSGFGVNWVYGGEFPTLTESVEAAIGSEHPYCAEFLAPLAAEAQSALVLFPGERAMQDGLSPVVGWATPQALRQLLQAIDDHMRREHVALP
ncbi:hypothetical protein AB0K93_08845 [Streptomyces sp. NPDC052676]|uniref:hypothetical protein n=1 Tax=Streptomyces sp. NPDC052676 TaxID=3154953 RepID=UPI00341E2FCB